MQSERVLERLLSELRRLGAEMPRLRERAMAAGRAIWDEIEAGEPWSAASHDELLNAAHQLLLVVASVRRTTKALLSLTGYGSLHRSLTAFEGRSQDANTFRDFFEHLDAYATGTGNLSADYQWPDMAESAIFASGDVHLAVRGEPHQLIVGITNAIDAGAQLAAEVLAMAPNLHRVLAKRTSAPSA